MMAHLKAMHKDINKARALREEDKTLAKEGRDAEKKAKDCNGKGAHILAAD